MGFLLVCVIFVQLPIPLNFTADANSVVANVGSVIESASSATVRVINFEYPHVLRVDNYDILSVEGCGFLSDVGEPMLPVMGLLIELPSADIIEVRFTSPDNALLPDNYLIYPAQPPGHLSDNGDQEFVGPNQEAYSHTWFPGRLGELMYTSSGGGTPMAYVRVFPLQYLPAENRVVYHGRVEVEVTVRTQLAVAPLSQDPDPTVDYLIITRPMFLGALENFVVWKESKGLSVEVEIVDNIVQNFGGRDVPEMIRNCIKKYYEDNGIKWVLLAGDADNDDGPYGGLPGYSLDKDWEVPTRYVWNDDGGEGGWISMDENWTPTDYYYAGLDGDWDGDADNYFGENRQRNAAGVDEVDWLAEVYVGRMPARTPSEMGAIVGKTIGFGNNPIPSNNFLSCAGGDTRPEWDNYSWEVKENVRRDCTPPSLNVLTLYERDAALSFTGMNSAINTYDPPFINVAGHGSPVGIVLTQSGACFESKGTEGQITNSGFLEYALSCLTNAFDETNTKFSSYGDSLGENLLKAPGRGAVAYVGGTRTLWVMGFGDSLPRGAACQDYLFWDSFFDVGDENRAYRPGAALYESKASYFRLGPDLDDEVERKDLFATVLLGDPELMLDAVPPGAPTLVSPGNGENLSDNAPTFAWTEVADPSGVAYNLWVDDDPDFSSPEVELTSAENSLYGVELAEGTYYWRIQAVDGAGNAGDNSDTWAFTVDLSPPAKPELLSPADGTQTAENRPTFGWAAVTDPSGVTYKLEAWHDSSPVIEAIGLTENTFTPTDALPDENYSWRVTAIDGVGKENASDMWTFLVDTTPPPPPALVSPENNTWENTRNPVLSWEDVVDKSLPVYYHIAVSDNPEFPHENWSEWTTGKQATIALSEGMWYWRVQARDNAGNVGENSAMWVFGIAAPPWFVDGDNIVGLTDLMIVAYHYGEAESHPNWLPAADVDGDGSVGLSDLMIVAYHYGEMWA